MASFLHHVIYQCAQWVWLLVLMLAPWLYGGTRDWAVDCLNGLGGLAVVLWGLGCLMERRMPKIHWAVAGLILGLLGYGWCLALNPHLFYRADFFSFVQVSPKVSWLPGGVDGPTALRMMVRISVLCGGLGLMMDRSIRRGFRRQVWTVVGITGASVALFGVAQKISLNPILFWDQAEFGRTHFAAFRYHANAGAYLNLVWPLLVGLTVSAFRRHEKDLQRTVWFAGTTLAVVGILLNISRAALAVSGVLWVIMGIWIWRSIDRRGKEDAVVRRCLAFGGLILVIAVVFFLSLNRWKIGGAQSAGGRWLAYQVSWKMVQDVGVFGWGPGTWSLSFPFYTGGIGKRIPGIWLFAHEDYLQTLVEWGWVGTLGWAGLVLGGIVSGFRAVWSGSGRLSSADRTLCFTACVAVCGIFLHALVDFPLQIASLQIYTMTFLGLGWGARNWKTVDDPARGEPDLR